MTGRERREKRSSGYCKNFIAIHQYKNCSGCIKPNVVNQRAKIYILDRQFDNALKDVNKAISLSPKILFSISLSLMSI